MGAADLISRKGTSAWLANMGHPKLAEMVMDEKRFPPAVPKRGKWIESKGQSILLQNRISRGEVWRVCSECGAGHMIGHKYECDKAYHDTHHNFCPNCGADMRERE